MRLNPWLNFIAQKIVSSKIEVGQTVGLFQNQEIFLIKVKFKFMWWKSQKRNLFECIFMDFLINLNKKMLLCTV